MDEIKSHRDGTLPTGFEIFVFGSNRAGIHGAGAAKTARDVYGAELGMGEGKFGKSYALPTKDRDLKTLSILTVQLHVRKFIAYAKSRRGRYEFFITRVGCGLAGYSDADIAPMFAPPLGNCNYPESWLPYLTRAANRRKGDCGEVVHEHRAAGVYRATDCIDDA